MPGTTHWMQQIAAGALDDIFTKLYGAKAVQHQKSRYVSALESFVQTYGPREEISIYSTPGRTEIGGNHTDHNHGRVLAASVNLDIIAVVGKNSNHCAQVKSAGFGTPDSVDFAYLEPDSDEFGKSSALIRGVAAGIVKQNGTVGGFDAYTTNDVLRGSGLSSSAAFEVCMAQILNGEYNEGRFSAVALAQIGQYAENVFFGKPSGLMDQTACAVGSAITIDFENPGKPVVQQIPFDLEKHGMAMVITDTKGSHANLTGEYAAIRKEMERVAAHFHKPVLRDVDESLFRSQIALVRKTAGDRAVLRAIHFFEECRRVNLLAEAILSGNIESFLTLIVEGGHSSFEYNQNAYAIQQPTHQGVSLGLALSQLILQGRGAWRLQGGGFAGTIQAFAPSNILDEYCTALNNVFGQDACHVLQVRPVGTLKVV